MVKRLESRLRTVKETVAANDCKQPVNKLDKATLIEVGLPIKTEEQLKKFELDLLNMKFETRVVNILSCIFYY